MVQNSQNMSGTGNTRVNTPGIQNVKAMFRRIWVRLVGYEVLTNLHTLDNTICNTIRFIQHVAQSPGNAYLKASICTPLREQYISPDQYFP